jgi:hypothetical protein
MPDLKTASRLEKTQAGGCFPFDAATNQNHFSVMKKTY